jgi:hypothetical protein
MEDQHGGIAEAQDAVTDAVTTWRAGAGAADRDALAAALETLLERITEHLAAEEEHILPWAAAHMTPEEWGRLGEEGIGNLPKRLLPLVFGMLMYQADPQVIRQMLAEAPLVPRLLMPLLAPRAYAAYARKVHGTSNP